MRNLCLISLILTLTLTVGFTNAHADISSKNTANPDPNSKYETLSPFEIKNRLIDKAKDSAEKRSTKAAPKTMLNAGRGNPNFLNTTARKAFCILSLFAIELSEQQLPSTPSLGLKLPTKGIAEKLFAYIEENGNNDGGRFLKTAIEYAIDEFKIDPDALVFELCDNALGDFYPSPSRISVFQKRLSMLT